MALLVPTVSSVMMQKGRQEEEEEAEVVQVEEVMEEGVVNKDVAQKEAMVQEEPDPVEEWEVYEDEEEEEEEKQGVKRLSRVSLMYRVNCSEGDIGPPTRVNTTIQYDHYSVLLFWFLYSVQHYVPLHGCSLCPQLFFSVNLDCICNSSQFCCLNANIQFIICSLCLQLHLYPHCTVVISFSVS